MSIPGAARAAGDTLAESDPFFSYAEQLSLALTEAEARVRSLRADHLALDQRREALKGNPTTTPEGTPFGDLENRVLDLYRKKDTAETDLEACRQTISGLQQVKVDLEAECDRLCITNAQMEDDITRMAAKRTELETQLTGLKTETDELAERFTQQTKEVEKLTNLKSRRKIEIQEIQARVDEAQQAVLHGPLDHYRTSLILPVSGIAAVHFHPKFQSIFVCSSEKKLFQYALPGLNQLNAWSIEGPATNFRIDPSEKMIGICGMDRTVRILEMSTGRITRTFAHHTEMCTDALWVSENQILTSSKDRTVKVFDVNRGELLSTISSMRPVYSLCPTNDPVQFLAGCDDGHIRMIDIGSKQSFVRISKAHSKQITCLVIGPSKTMVYSVGLDGFVCESDITTGTRTHQWSHPELIVKAPLTRLAIDPIGRFLACGSNKGLVFLFDIQNPSREPTILEHHTAAVSAVAFSCNLLVTADKEQTVAFWN
jgi:predicted  nucleic acid-binding Zn-ribbon protein